MHTQEALTQDTRAHKTHTRHTQDTHKTHTRHTHTQDTHVRYNPDLRPSVVDFDNDAFVQKIGQIAVRCVCHTLRLQMRGRKGERKRGREGEGEGERKRGREEERERGRGREEERNLPRERNRLFSFLQISHSPFLSSLFSLSPSFSLLPSHLNPRGVLRIKNDG